MLSCLILLQKNARECCLPREYVTLIRGTVRPLLAGFNPTVLFHIVLRLLVAIAVQFRRRHHQLVANVGGVTAVQSWHTFSQSREFYIPVGRILLKIGVRKNYFLAPCNLLAFFKCTIAMYNSKEII